MKKVLLINIGSFWPATALTVVGLIAMGAVAEAATLLYKTPAGRQTALLIAVMRSREILDNAGVRGYYERLTGKYGKMDQDYIYDRSFRIFRFKPNLTWEHDHITTNSFGLVGREISLRKPPNTRRLAMVGASLTAGQGVPYKQTYPALLEDRLNTVKPDGPDERFEVLNFSTISYTLPQIVDTAIEDAPRFEPDVYLLDLNELAISAVWGRHLVQLTQLGIDAKYDFLRDILHQAGVSRADSSDALYGKLAPYRIAMLRGSLSTLEASVASRHASLIVLLLTSVEAGDLSKRRMATISEVLHELHVPVVDLMDSFDQFLDRSQLAAYPGDVHFNHRGHALLSENLYRKLRAQPDAWAAVVGPAPITIPHP